MLKNILTGIGLIATAGFLGRNKSNFGEFYASFKNNGKYVEIFKNPTCEEFKKPINCKKGARAFITKTNAYFWNAEKALHEDILDGIKDGKIKLPKKIIGVTITERERSHSTNLLVAIQMTSKFGPLYIMKKNPSIRKYIRCCIPDHEIYYDW